ncbi:MAG: ankyrin repeat domain-containing protein [Thermoguttaceae bacterium]
MRVFFNFILQCLVPLLIVICIICGVNVWQYIFRDKIPENIAQGNLPEVKKLIAEKKPTPQMCVYYVHKAGQFGKKEIIRYFVEELETPITPEDTLFVLYYNDEKDSPEIFQYLFEHFEKTQNIDANYCRNDASKISLLNHAIFGNHRSIIEYLLQKGADINLVDVAGNSPLFQAAICDNLEMIKFLREKGAKFDVSSTNANGDTFLHVIVQNFGSIPIFDYFLEEGADVDAKNNDGARPIHLVNSREICSLLIEKGVDLETPGTIKGTIQDPLTPLEAAVFRCNAHVASLLMDAGAAYDVHKNYRTVTGGMSLLGFFAREGNIEQCKKMIEEGADVNQKMSSGKTPLHLASETYSESNNCKLLIDNGADVNAIDENGDTPLHGAARMKWRSPERYDLLVAAGADKNIKNNDGKSPSDLKYHGFFSSLSPFAPKRAPWVIASLCLLIISFVLLHFMRVFLMQFALLGSFICFCVAFPFYNMNLFVFSMFWIWELHRFSKKNAKIQFDKEWKVFNSEYESVKVDASEFTWLDLEYYDKTEEELESLGFTKERDSEFLTHTKIFSEVRNFYRIMANEDFTVFASISNVRVVKLKNWMERQINVKLVEFTTCFSDNTFLITCNGLGVNPIGSFEGVEVCNMPQNTPLEDLLDAHEERCDEICETRHIGLIRLPTEELQQQYARFQFELLCRDKQRKGGFTVQELQQIIPNKTNKTDDEFADIYRKEYTRLAAKKAKEMI